MCKKRIDFFVFMCYNLIKRYIKCVISTAEAINRVINQRKEKYHVVVRKTEEL